MCNQNVQAHPLKHTSIHAVKNRQSFWDKMWSSVPPKMSSQLTTSALFNFIHPHQTYKSQMSLSSKPFLRMYFHKKCISNGTINHAFTNLVHATLRKIRQIITLLNARKIRKL